MVFRQQGETCLWYLHRSIGKSHQDGEAVDSGTNVKSNYPVSLNIRDLHYHVTGAPWAERTLADSRFS